MDKAYKTDYILENYTPGEIQKLAGVPAFVTAKLQRGEISLTGKTSAKLKYFYNREKKAELKTDGVPVDMARYLIRNFEADEIQNHADKSVKIAEMILQNKIKKYPNTTLEHILDGMSRSFRQDVGDWIQYFKEKKYKTRAINKLR